MTTTLAPTATPAFVQTLPTWAVGLMADKVAKANRKAARNGLGEPFALTIIATREWVEESPYGAKITRSESDVAVTGDSPSLPGWAFAATIDWTLESPVINTSPFYSGPTLPRPESKICEHCGTVRSRNETFLVTGPDGAVSQVGRQCLTVFTGISPGWVSLADSLEVDEDDFASYGSGDYLYSVQSVLGLGIRLVDALGYVSKSKAEDLGQVSTTARFIVAHDGARTAQDREIEASNNAALATRSRSDEAVATEVAAIIAWGATLDGSDYLLNLRAVLGERGWLSQRHLGYGLSSVATFRRATEQAARVAVQRAERSPVVEGRGVITGTVLSVEVRESNFGPQVKCRIAVDNGSVLWGTLPRAIESATPGDTVEFVATVTASGNDPTFGFFARPVKAKIIARASA